MTDNVLQVGNTDRKNQKSVKIKYQDLIKAKMKKTKTVTIGNRLSIQGVHYRKSSKNFS